jgi:hypothetical protein
MLGSKVLTNRLGRPVLASHTGALSAGHSHPPFPPPSLCAHVWHASTHHSVTLRTNRHIGTLEPRICARRSAPHRATQFFFSRFGSKVWLVTPCLSDLQPRGVAGAPPCPRAGGGRCAVSKVSEASRVCHPDLSGTPCSAVGRCLLPAFPSVLPDCSVSPRPRPIALQWSSPSCCVSYHRLSPCSRRASPTHVALAHARGDAYSATQR